MLLDSCNNALVQYFLDKDCTVDAGTGPAGAYDDSCQDMSGATSGSNNYGRLICTTASVPPAFSDSFMDV